MYANEWTNGLTWRRETVRIVEKYSAETNYKHRIEAVTEVMNNVGDDGQKDDSL